MANTAIQLAEALRSRFDLPVGFRERRDSQLFATGVRNIDQVLSGGLPRAALSEISGPASSNRTSLTVAILARAFDAGECCAWIDAGGMFDPDSAATAGLQLERLLWINCRGSAEHALKAADLLLHGGGFGIMVFDLADVAEKEVKRISLTSWFRLRRAAEETGTALIALTASPQTRSCSALSIELKREKSLWRGKLFRGITTALELRKHYRSQGSTFESVI